MTAKTKRKETTISIIIPSWINESAKDEMIDTIKKICHLFADDNLKVIVK